MIMWSLSSFTLNVVLGKVSITTPSISICSSFAIRSPMIVHIGFTSVQKAGLYKIPLFQVTPEFQCEVRFLRWLALSMSVVLAELNPQARLPVDG